MGFNKILILINLQYAIFMLGDASMHTHIHTITDRDGGGRTTKLGKKNRRCEILTERGYKKLREKLER